MRKTVARRGFVCNLGLGVVFDISEAADKKLISLFGLKLLSSELEFYETLLVFKSCFAVELCDK